MNYLEIIGSRIPVFSGTRLQIGRGIGEYYKEIIINYVANRKDLLAKEFRLFGEEYKPSMLNEASTDVAEYIKRATPQEWDELCGISDSTNVHVDDLLIAFGYTDALDYALKLHGKKPSDIKCELVDAITSECSLLIDARNKIRSIQTWDMPKNSELFCVVHKKEPNNEPSLFTFGIAGAPCYIGLNEYGVCVGTANLSTLDAGVGLPFPFLISRMLGHTTAVNAVNWAQSVHRMSGHYFYVIDKDDAFSCELSLNYAHVEKINKKVSHHTNHFIQSDHDNEYCVGRSSLIRKKFIESIIENDNINSIDRFHEAATRCELPLCRQPEKDNVFNTETVGIVQFCPVDRWMSYIIGHPWANSETTLSF